MDEPTYRHTVDGECIDGATLPAFIKNADVYSFKNICIYSDGLIEGGR